MNSKVIRLCNLMVVSMVLSGCGSRAAFNQRNFVLETSREIPRQKTSKDVILDVQNFSIDTTFSSKSLVYRKGQSEYETDFYNQFLIKPDDMITEKTRNWLSKSGLFKWVLDPGSYTEPSHVLEGNITALYGDFRDDSSPKAIIEIRVFLVKSPESSVVFGKTYEVTSEVESKTAGALLEALDKCLINILSDLEKDLQEQL